MRSGRAAFPLFLLVTAAATPFLLAPPVPEVRAAEPPPPAAVPAVCREPLPLPSELPFEKSEYEAKLGRFLQAECYLHLGWQHDRQLRVTGPTAAVLGTSSSDPHLPAWVTSTWGMHNTVLIYYSPDVYRWLCERDARGERHFVEACRTSCPDCRLEGGEAEVRPIADGSMILKMMFGNTTEEILEDPSIGNRPRPGMALMVKDSPGSKDGWWWGAWLPANLASEKAQLDWPPPTNFPYPWMGSGYYCVNCHGSADNPEFTFSELNNIHGDPNSFTTFYFQDQPPLLDPDPTDDQEVADEPTEMLSAHDRKLPGPSAAVKRVSQPLDRYSPAFLSTFGARVIRKPTWDEAETTLAMPPEPYDHVVSSAHGPPLFLTSDQCVSCHAAGATGMHFDMTLQPAGQPAFSGLLNLAPYGEWRSSPMGLAGRDPIFLSQLESEQTLHAGLGEVIPDLCLHCHGVMGQRQYCLDQFAGDPHEANRVCDNTALLGLNRDSRPIVPRRLFNRAILDAIPFRATTERQRRDSKYGALARDGVSCAVCHHVRIDRETPFGHTFTGDFRVGDAARIQGPFADPQEVPMEHSLGLTPVEDPDIRSSKICGSCHSVVLPVFDGSKPYVRPGETVPEVIIEQATYPEWVFSDFRDGGPTPQSCQNCHMPTKYPGFDEPLEFKIAAIQEASNMPQVENRRPLSVIDLKPRADFARHTLVGLNVFFNKFAQQFPDILGIRIQDPMLVGHGVAPLATTFNSMLQQADTASATVAIENVAVAGGSLTAEVRIANLAGHKFPSGVGFRRLFVEFAVLDAAGRPLWVSGGTDATGVLVNAAGKPLAGEFFWHQECRPMSAAEQRGLFQPHYTTITRQDQAQVYQELVRDPRGKFTTSFLSLADGVKDNRLLPRGWDPSLELARREGLGSPKLPAEELVEDVLPILPDGRGGKVRDPSYLPKSQGGLGGGGDTLTYAVPLADLPAGSRPASVQATLYYQAIPPFYLQDRFCTTPRKPDTSRLFFLAGHLDLSGTRAADWKLKVVSSGRVAVPAAQAAANATQRAGLGARRVDRGRRAGG
ncbi:MAG TPA: hypothetical protein VF121_17590 [Thermoanaerobaculia bacterium]|nr:hypothetical protein [Thermoanaerobaculia bacterium]